MTYRVLLKHKRHIIHVEHLSLKLLHEPPEQKVCTASEKKYKTKETGSPVLHV